VTRAHHIAFTAHAVLLAAAACSAYDGAWDADAGKGGAFVFGPVSSSSAKSSGASAHTDAGFDVALPDGCSSCKDALHGPDHLAAELTLCPSPDGGHGPFVYWLSYVNCGCAKGGPCALDCASSAYCTGVFPVPGTWTDPEGTCAACLAADGATGCGDEAYFCAQH